MDLSKLTLQELRESRDDLVQVILSEADEGKNIKTLEDQLQALQETVEGYKAKEAKQALQEAILGELKAAGLDPANKAHVSQVFMEDLSATADPAQRKAKIDDRKALVAAAGRVPALPVSSSPLQEGADGAAIPPVTTPLSERIRRFAK